MAASVTASTAAVSEKDALLGEREKQVSEVQAAGTVKFDELKQTALVRMQELKDAVAKGEADVATH